MPTKGDGPIEILQGFAGKLSHPLTLALISVVFYIFSYVYFRAYQSERSIPYSDFPFEFFLIAGYVLLRKIVEIAICGLAIISFYEFRENLKNKTTKPTSHEKIVNAFFNSYPIFAYLTFIYFFLALPLNQSVGYIILSFITLITILAIKLDLFNGIRKSLLWSSFVVPFSYILLIGSMLLFLFVLPQLWGYNAAVHDMKQEQTITLKLINNSSGLSNLPFFFRSYQNGRFVVAENRSNRSIVHIIPDSQVINATLKPNRRQSEDDCFGLLPRWLVRPLLHP